MDNFIEAAARIKRIVGSPEAANKLPDLLPLLSDQMAQKYFFEQLEDVTWLDPLSAAGLFGQPPQVIRKQGRITIPTWPASEYLSRSANLAPEKVMNIIFGVPETANMAVHRDFAEAALADSMPPTLIAEWATREAEWIRRQGDLYLGLPMKLGAVVKRLAQTNKTNAALALANALLDVLPELRQAEETSGAKSWTSMPEPRTRFDLWEYEQILNSAAPALIAAAPDQTLAMFADLLGKALSPSRREAKDVRADYSYIWRPAIEASGQNPNLGAKPILVTAVRDAAEAISAAGHEQAVKVRSALEERGKDWLVFQRIALHILRKFPDMPAIAERLTNRELFDEVGVRHEYVLLLGENFSKLKPKDQETILAWIENGPNTPDLKGRLQDWLGREVTDSEVEESKNAWQRERLAPIKKDLTGNWKAFYESLTKVTGDPEHPEFPVYSSGGAFGPKSPKTSGELAEMPPEQLANFLDTWDPETADPIHGATIAGLAQELTSLVSKEPDHLAPHLEKFHLLEPSYARAIISGFDSALTLGRELEWGNILRYCAWAAQQEDAAPAAPPHPLQILDRDLTWRGTRQAILRLLSTALDKDPCPIPFNIREWTWDSLEPCTHDPDPSLEDEAKFLGGGITEESEAEGLRGQNLDVLSYSINTARGEAMQTVVRYARWVHRNLTNQRDGTSGAEPRIAAMPEVRVVLESRLDPVFEPTAAVRCVYGRVLPWLYQIDPTWTKKTVPLIFPTEPEQEVLWAAAWEAYVASWAATIPMYEILRSQYRRAVEKVGTWPERVKHIVDLDDQLARHLMVLNSFGALAPEVLTAFYERASDELRSQAMNFVGWSLYQQKEAIPSEILGRLKVFWESRLRAAHENPSPTKFAKEMAQFGWWFASDKFDDLWALNQLRQALEISHQALPEHFVLPKLAEISNRMPLEAVECLALLAEGSEAPTGPGPLAWEDSGPKIVDSALNSDDLRARQRAIELSNRLASLGHFRYIEIVTEATRKRPT